MGKYLKSEGRQEQRGRPEDGVPGLKGKWQKWPGVEEKGEKKSEKKEKK